MTNERSAAAAAMGRARTARKAAAVRENGKRGGDCRKWYYLLSGEGEIGTWERVFTTPRGARARAAKLRADGDRWASAWELVPETDDCREHVRELDGGNMREVPDC